MSAVTTNKHTIPQIGLEPGEGTTLLQAFGDVTQLLTILGKLSIAQKDAVNSKDWQRLLAQKQRLLDKVAAYDCTTLFQRAKVLADGAKTQGDAALARELHKATRQIHEQFGEVLMLENAAQLHLQRQIGTIRQSLTDQGQQRQVRRMYQGASPTPAPRFLSGQR